MLQAQKPILDISDSTLADALEGRPTFVVVDREVDARYGIALREYAARRLSCLGIYVLDALESSKSLRNVEAISDAAYDAGLPRNGVVLGVGGGVTLDQAGLAASLYRRGVRYARVPTTLVAIVDVSVGIKQGVNGHGGKNVLGSFYPAYTCINDVTFLKSLSRRAIACGIAEIVKMAVICDPALFALLELYGQRLVAKSFQRMPTANDVIFRAQAAMMDELRDNLYEEQHARSVDFGHTFSPALERASAYEVPHGEAVAIDMVLSAAIAVQFGLCSRDSFDRLVSLFRSVGLPTSHPLLDIHLAGGAFTSARAHRGGFLNLVVPKKIGSVAFIDEVELPVLKGALALTNPVS